MYCEVRPISDLVIMSVGWDETHVLRSPLILRDWQSIHSIQYIAHGIQDLLCIGLAVRSQWIARRDHG